MFHTVYLSFETGRVGRDYIGKHSTEDPYDVYKGSFQDKTFNPDGKIVLEYAKTEEGAVAAEIRWQKVFRVAEDPQFVNRSYQTSDKFTFDTRGEKHPLYGTKRPDITERNLTDNPAKRPEVIEKMREVQTGNTNSKGKLWWIKKDGTRTRALECPGGEWQRGMVWGQEVYTRKGK
jgi:hypothetical protein